MQTPVVWKEQGNSASPKALTITQIFFWVVHVVLSIHHRVPRIFQRYLCWKVCYIMYLSYPILALVYKDGTLCLISYSVPIFSQLLPPLTLTFYFARTYSQKQHSTAYLPQENLKERKLIWMMWCELLYSIHLHKIKH